MKTTNAHKRKQKKNAKIGAVDTRIIIYKDLFTSESMRGFKYFLTVMSLQI